MAKKRLHIQYIIFFCFVVSAIHVPPNTRGGGVPVPTANVTLPQGQAGDLRIGRIILGEPDTLAIQPNQRRALGDQPALGILADTRGVEHGPILVVGLGRKRNRNVRVSGDDDERE